MEHIYTLHVHGMHCKACTVLIEDKLKNDNRVVAATADLAKGTVTVSGNFEKTTPEELARSFSKQLEPHGYSFTAEKTKDKGASTDFRIATPIALSIITAFVLLQKAGLVNFIGGGELGYGSIFLIGVIASLSSCMAVVGGLLLSLSASFAKKGDALYPQTIFHVGRIVAFFFLGGIIGALGTAFTLSTLATFALNLIIGVVMLILGINLLDIFQGVGRIQFSMPSFFVRHVRELSKMNHTFTPFFVGMATFFLPCGFTQSMQLYTLSTGSFIAGGFTMLVFALGTFPALAAVSYSSLSVARSPYKGVFYKTAGLIVIAFAIMNMVNAFVIMGFIPPIFNF